VTQAANDKQQMVPLVEKNSPDRNRKEFWPTTGIARMKI
jgi:hypothetical protein